MTKLLPPFGEQVRDTLADPKTLQHRSGCTATRGTVWILTGEGAPEKHNTMPHHLTVILPHGARPSDFCWDFIAGHEPALVWCDSTDFPLVDAIWRALESDGVNSALFGAGNWRSTYKRTENKNAA